MTGSISASSSSQATSPEAASSAVAQRVLRRADAWAGQGDRHALADRGRRVRHRAHHRIAGRSRSDRRAIGSPARMDSTTAPAADAPQHRQGVGRHLRLDRQDHRFRLKAGGTRSSAATRVSCARATPGGSSGSTSTQGGRPARAPAGEHRRPHPPCAKQQDGGQRRRVQASPTHSSMAASSASAGVLPPHSTNWNAG